jgi:hypothetical protein
MGQVVSKKIAKRCVVGWQDMKWAQLVGDIGAAGSVQRRT